MQARELFLALSRKPVSKAARCINQLVPRVSIQVLSIMFSSVDRTSCGIYCRSGAAPSAVAPRSFYVLRFYVAFFPLFFCRARRLSLFFCVQSYSNRGKCCDVMRVVLLRSFSLRLRLEFAVSRTCYGSTRGGGEVSTGRPARNCRDLAYLYELGLRCQ